MAATPDPQPGHAKVAEIDKAFTNAPRLAGWLEYLAHPEQHKGPRLVAPRRGSGEEPAPSEYQEAKEPPYPDAGPGQSPYYDTKKSVLRDLKIEQFFDAAQVLTGQDIGSIERAVTAIEEIRHRRDGKKGPNDLNDTVVVYKEMVSALGLLLPTWTDQAGQDFGKVYVKMQTWYDRRTEEMLTLEKRLVEYAAAIETARRNLNKVMGALADALASHTAEDIWDDPALPVIGRVVAFGLDKIDPTGAVAMVFSELFDLALKEAEKDNKPAGLTGDSYYKILNSFLDAARDVLDKLVATTKDLAERKAVDGRPLQSLREGFPPLPQLA